MCHTSAGFAIFGHEDHPGTLVWSVNDMIRAPLLGGTAHLDVGGHFVGIFEGLAGPVPVLLQPWWEAVGVLFAVLADGVRCFGLKKIVMSVSKL